MDKEKYTVPILYRNRKRGIENSDQYVEVWLVGHVTIFKNNMGEWVLEKDDNVIIINAQFVDMIKKVNDYLKSCKDDKLIISLIEQVVSNIRENLDDKTGTSTQYYYDNSSYWRTYNNNEFPGSPKLSFRCWCAWLAGFTFDISLYDKSTGNVQVVFKQSVMY